jgi:hypothetical protein
LAADRAYLAGLRLLARRELSEAQVRTRLERRQFDPDDIAAAVGSSTRWFQSWAKASRSRLYPLADRLRPSTTCRMCSSWTRCMRERTRCSD